MDDDTHEMICEDIWRHESLNMESVAFEVLHFENRDRNQDFVFGKMARLTGNVTHIHSWPFSKMTMCFYHIITR
jgi:hypothetical protein